MEETNRCRWCRDNGILQHYHDTEWGYPVRDDRKQFEFLTLEVMQCGLNWTMMLKKRETFRLCFDNFEYEKIAKYGEGDIVRILAVPDMIRSRRKIEAVITNARKFLEISSEYGSFTSYIWHFTGNRTVLYDGHGTGQIPAKTVLSDLISSDLKKRGFKYTGSITVYSHLQANGIVNDHTDDCFLYQKLLDGTRIVRMQNDDDIQPV